MATKTSVNHAKRYETEYVTLDKLITVEETAEMLGISAARVRQLIADNRFRKVTQVGSRPLNLLNLAEVERMVESRA
jgi:excisionase family DNA binding protein